VLKKHALLQQPEEIKTEIEKLGHTITTTTKIYSMYNIYNSAK
jgi:hypothetical protein